MHILYLSEWGVEQEATYYVLAGLAVPEQEVRWYSQDLDALQTDYFGEETAPIYLSASDLLAGEEVDIGEPWSRLPKDSRAALVGQIYEILSKRRGVLFASAVEKLHAAIMDHEPDQTAFEDLTARFNAFMARVNSTGASENGEEERTFLVLSSAGDDAANGLPQSINDRRTWLRDLKNMVDMPLLAPARHSRMLQYAEFCSAAVYERYHSKHTGHFDRIATRFDQEDGVLHGLAHHSGNFPCSCIACFSRRRRK